MPVRPTLLFALLATGSLQPALTQNPPQSASLKTTSQLVVVDVTVTDSKQNPVHNLTASDFTVLENNTPEHIKTFEEHTAASIKPEPPLNLPPGNFTNYTNIPAGAPLNILLLDTLNTPLEDQAYVHTQLRLFLKNSPPNALLAIFGLSTHLWLLQPFTADPQLLRAAIDTKSQRNSPLVESKARGYGSESLSEKLKEVGGVSNISQSQLIMHLQQFEAESSSATSQLRARYTLEAFNQIAHYLAGMPGKKNLIWFSGSFPLSVLPDSTLLGPYTDPFSTVAGSSDLFRETTRLLAQNQVAVFPVGAGGVTTSSVYSAEESGVQYNTYLHPLDTFANNLIAASGKSSDNNVTMIQMADATGGHAFINTNGLATAVNRVIATGSDFYTLTYTPSTTITDGKFRRIQLKLRQDGYTLAYRRGYYADAPAPTPAPTSVTVSNDAPHFVQLTTAHVADPMQNAMIFGSPSPTQITLKVLVVPAAGKPEDTLTRSNYAIPSARLIGPYHRFDITIAADPADIVFTPEVDGSRHASLLFRTYLYSRDGKLLNTSSRVDERTFTAELYTRALHAGLLFHQEISVPLKGEYYLRIGVHDVTANHDGALEIPVDAVKNLPPVTAPPVAEPLARRQ